jgi:acetylornithine/succinyldiaminopimelate/putrescine aminotransferase/predicted amino acid dehydrogenase/acyl-coenzyme A synthetase/AMP-(fatty) acid ligase
MSDRVARPRDGGAPTHDGVLVFGGPPPPPDPGMALPALLLAPRAGERPHRPILLGTRDGREWRVTLGQLRWAVLELADEFERRGLPAGATVCLLRLPRTSEAALAVAYAALTCFGARVLLPMFTEAGDLVPWLRRTGARAVIWAATELEGCGTPGDRERFAGVRDQVRGHGLAAWCLRADLRVEELVGGAPADGPDTADPRVAALVGRGATDAECLVLTTAGSNGHSKLVRYRQGALLRSCAAWQAAGLYAADRLGGTGLCLLFSHSMGVRAFWNAVWTRAPLCLIPPEWFLEHPDRVRALLVRMRPAHVTGGPAVYHALLEFARLYPDVKDSCLASLRCLVSSGAPFDAAVARRVEACFGLPLRNAFGTTETMQVLSTLMPPVLGPELGGPLPGVRVRLEPCGVPSQRLYRLLVASPFGASGYLGAAARRAPTWHPTGDLVRRNGAGFEYAGRDDPAVVKDGFGVKVPRALIARRYAGLGAPIRHIEVLPLTEEPGLAGLVFVDPDVVPAAAGAEAPLVDPPTLRRVRAILEGRHEELARSLDDFELRHLTLGRFACVAGDPPRTAKGNVSHEAIGGRWPDLLGALGRRWHRRAGLVRLERDAFLRSSAVRYVRPRLGELMRCAKLDREYVEGEGDRLRWRDGPRQGTVVDFVGGFGVTLLGHHHPDVVAAARRLIDGAGVLLADQGAERRPEGDLARRLSALVGRITGGSYVVRFGSTGAEAVEMAIAHAWLEWRAHLRARQRALRHEFGARWPAEVREVERAFADRVAGLRPVLLALETGFHGYSLGARTVSALRNHRAEFAPLLGIECRRLRDTDADALASVLASCDVRVPALVARGDGVERCERPVSRIIAAFAEPVRGEGGIAVTDRGLLRALAGRGFPLVLDEIQCGLGRTGRLLASEGVHGDYYLLGKALGGGIAKLSALLIDRARYRPTFDDHYAGTYQGDAFSCGVGAAVLDVIERDDIPARARSRGACLRAALDGVASRHPDVIRGVAGEGLMLGVSLGLPEGVDRLPLRMLAAREKLGFLASAYLLNRWDVRVLPALSAPDTIRLEPSAFVDDEAIGRLARGLEDFCSAVARGDGAALFAFLVADELAIPHGAPLPARLPAWTSRVETPAPGAVRVAFLYHFVLVERELAMVDPTLRAWPAAARRALFDRLETLLELHPVVGFGRNLCGGRVWFAAILIPAQAASLEDLHRRGLTDELLDRLREALDLGRRLGCTIAGLGAYTSVVTDAGLALGPPEGMRLSTGNAFTAALGARRVRRIAARRGVDLSRPETCVGVLGATGNIGAAVARLLADSRPAIRRLCLVGRDPVRLGALRSAIVSGAGAPDVSCATDLAALAECDVVVTAVSTNEPLVAPHHLRRDRPVLIVDLSVPTAVCAAVHRLGNVHVAPAGGTVRVPGTPDFVMASHIPAGRAFGCAAEALLLALEPAATRDLRLVGPIDPDAAHRLERLAERAGMLGTCRAGAAV